MNFFNKLSLKNKIFLSCLGFILLVSIIIALFTRAILISGLTSELKIRGTGIAQTIAENARTFILTKNRAELTALAYDARLGKKKDIVKYLIITDFHGNILAHSFTVFFPEKLRTIVKRQNRLHEEVRLIKVLNSSVFHVWVPVKEGIYTIGSVQIGLDKHHIDALIANLRLVFLSFVSVVTIIFFILSNRLAYHITKPVSSLIKYTDQITKGDFNIIDDIDSERLPEVSGAENDEIGKLTNSFMKMTAKLKISTDRLMESERKYRSLFTSGPNPIFVIEKENYQILDVNPKVKETFGYTKKEILGMNFLTLGRLEKENFERQYTEGDSVVISSKVEFYKKTKDIIFVNLHATPSKYYNKNVLIVAATDISALIEKDSQLIQASKMTNLEKMSAGIAHEINQPLNAVKMGTEFLCMMQEEKRKIKRSTYAKILKEISGQVTRAAEIVDRLKKFSRKTDFSREVIDINHCVRSVNKIIGRQIALQNINLDLNLDNSIPAVLAHNNRIEQVIFNLLTNARDAINQRIEENMDIDEGRIVVSTFSDKKTVFIKVSDNGAGIRAQDMDKIFESFYTTKEMGEGMGLGLPIIHGIVKDYNGTIGVKSTEGQGSSFEILFPAYFEKAIL